MIKISKYNPQKIVRKGKITIINDQYVLKENKNEDIYKYLQTRNFNYFPKVIENDNDNIVYEYVNEIKYPKEQKLFDLVDLTALLHSKTTYFKETDEDKFKTIYEDIKNNIAYLNSYYNDKANLIETKEIYTPSEYLLIRNISKIFKSLDIANSELDKFINEIPDKMRNVVVHNNLNLDHYIKSDRDYLLSWEKSKFDLPVFDLYKLFKRNNDFNYIDLINRYEKNYPLLNYEKRLIIILMRYFFLFLQHS